MPFTPFHMGPGIALKAGADRHFSLLAFGVAQVAMDIEPLVGMIRGAAVLHGVTHTYPGALAIGAVVTGACRFAGPPLLRRFHRAAIDANVRWLACAERPPTRVLALGAFAGTVSHVALDSLMHADMQPFWPFSSRNPLLGLLPWQEVYALCFWLGIAGTLAWVVRRYRRGRPRG